MFPGMVHGASALKGKPRVLQKPRLKKLWRYTMSETNPRRITERDRMIARRLSNLWSVKKRELELTQEKVAEAIGVTQSAYSQMLHCRMVIPTETILKLALVFRESPIKIDPSFYKRFDINSNAQMRMFLALEISRLSKDEQTDLLTLIGPDNDCLLYTSPSPRD